MGHILRACSSTFAEPISRKRPNSVEPTGDHMKKLAAIEGPISEDINDSELAAMTHKEKDLDIGIISAKVAGMPCEFLIDSGAQVNTFTTRLFEKLRSQENYLQAVYNVNKTSDKLLKAYATSAEISVHATFEAFLYISEDRPKYLEKFYVVDEQRCLLGRPTATRYNVLLLGLKVPIIDQPSYSPTNVRVICSLTNKEIFPKFNIPAIKINFDRSAPPCRNIYTNIPISLKPLVRQRLDQLVKSDIIEKVESGMDTSFCSSMLVVPKGKDNIRLVIDLRGPNKYIYRSPFIMPTLESILADLNGSSWFSTIDLSNAFHHIVLDEESRHLTNFFTEFGMFRCVRMPFGLCNAPDIFQEVLQRKILIGCKGVKNYLDDILIFGPTRDEHDENLKNVMARLKEHNVKLNESKCCFGQQSVIFLGFKLTTSGWEIEDEKIKAIRNFKSPATCSEVKSFLGLVTFVDRFLINRADKTKHLRDLVNKNQFYWTKKEEEEFKHLRDLTACTIQRLGYYNPRDRTELLVDASPIGLGAVLVQFNEKSTPRVISCASKSLTPTEQRYPQTHKEALAVVWGVERFSTYLLNISFIVRTDAEANEFIFNGKYRLGRRAISRAESWALRLQQYDFSIQRIPGNLNIADVLSRLINNTKEAVPFDADDDNHFLYTLDAGCMNVTWQEIEKQTERDEELQKVKLAIKTHKWHGNLNRFEAHKKELRFLGNLIFKDNKVVLPQTLKIKAIKSAHEGHIGEVAMKRIMRDFFWWPGMSTDIGKFIKACETCIMISKKNPPVPLSCRELPDGPWEIIQIDFLSIPGCGSGEFLIVVDTYSRYISVVEMRAIDADCTNAALCKIFLLWGLPKIIQSDNGPPFKSTNFVTTWEDKGVRVRKAIPLSPQSNGSVERQNQGIIKAITAAKIDGTNWRSALQKYVHNHNTLIPHSRLNVTPFELLVGWKFRGNFPSLWMYEGELDRCDIRERDAEAKLKSKVYADATRHAMNSNIVIGDWVLLAHPKKTKTDPTFPAERFRVIAMDGPKIVVMSMNGIQYTRNVQEVKRVSPSINEPEQAPCETSTQRLRNNELRTDEGKSLPLTITNEETSLEEAHVNNEMESAGKRCLGKSKMLTSGLLAFLNNPY
ncbi:uncharacterized protein K02A2.6-like [Malaya genurostris]|uniref:uncharacterized protein K02A2.6-like n=1 Tax=Malaya genurostris TaxID=325434 RepID=UPI0026F3B1A4|nr:uncharacterized protein K02A2.6-like [Malaya genurostris]